MSIPIARTCAPTAGTPRRGVTSDGLPRTASPTKSCKDHWQTLKAETEHPIPKFVKAEVEAYLRCGILAYGFVRTACVDCGHEELVAFSCKSAAASVARASLAA